MISLHINSDTCDIQDPVKVNTCFLFTEQIEFDCQDCIVFFSAELFDFFLFPLVPDNVFFYECDSKENYVFMPSDSFQYSKDLDYMFCRFVLT